MSRLPHGVMVASIAVSCMTPSMAAGVGVVVDIREYGAIANDETDDTSAIQEALDVVSRAGGGTVRIPAGTFLLAPRGQRNILNVASHTVLEGVGPSSRLRVASRAGDYGAVIGAADESKTLEGAVFRDFLIDQNPQGNTTSTIVVGVKGKGQAALSFVRLLDLRVERMVFDRATGVNTVSLNGPMARRATIRDSLFVFEKARTADAGSSYDNSAIYLDGSEWTVLDNRFESRGPAGMARTAIEIHGGPAIVSRNQVSGYQSGCHVVSRSGKDVEASPRGGVVVAGNTFTGVNRGINLWSRTGAELRSVVITGNVIEIDSKKFGGLSHAGISMIRDSVSGDLDGGFSGIAITGNTIRFEKDDREGYPYADSGGIQLYPRGSVANTVVSGNVVIDAPTQGIRVQSGLGEASAVNVSANVITGSGSNIASTARSAVVVSGRVDSVAVAHNVLQRRVRSRAQESARVSNSGIPRSGTYEVSNFSGRVSEQDKNDQNCADRLVSGSEEFRTVDLGANRTTAIAAPSHGVRGQRWVLLVRNTSTGEVPEVSWDKSIRMGAWTSPAPGYGRVVEFYFDDALWIEASRSAEDIRLR